MSRQIMTGFSPPSQAELEERIGELERKLTVLTEAVAVMAQGLKGAPATGPDPGDAANASRLAHELLIAARMAPKQDRDR